MEKDGLPQVDLPAETESDAQQTQEPLRRRLITRTIQQYERQQRVIEMVGDSSFYYYTVPDVELDFNTVPHLDWETIDRMYSPIRPQMERFQKAQSALLERGRSISSKELTIEELMAMNAKLLDPVYDLVNGLKAFNFAKPRPPRKQYKKQPEFIQILNKRYLDNIETEKPEEARETLRRYIPRWMTHPIPPPVSELEDEQMSLVEDEWANFTTKDADLLIHPDRISEGAPLHVVFKLAEKMEKQEKSDLGYALRTYGISKILEMEVDRLNDPENPEIPFFSFIMAGSMTGFSFSYARKSFFDFSTAINDTMSMTHQRLMDELESGQNGPASQFLDILNNHFPNAFPGLFALSIVNHSLRTKKIDEIKMIKGLQRKSPEWFEAFMNNLSPFSVRRVLYNHEIEEVMDSMPPVPESIDIAKIEDNAREIIGDEDSYSISRSMRFSFLKDIEKGNTVSALKLDLDALSETISVQVIGGKDQKARIVPFKLSFSGEIEPFSLETLDDHPVSEEVLEVLRKKVAEVLHSQLEEKRKREQTLTSGKAVRLNTVKVDKPLPLTRKERMIRYQLEKERDRKQKTKGETSEAMELAIPETNPPVANEEAVLGTPRRILNLDYPTIIGLLEEQRIGNIDPERMYNKLEFLLEVANVGGKILGKKIGTHPLSESELQGEEINLRQINWVLDGGATALRIYLEDVKGGDFIIQGILLKQSENQQTRYIRQLLLKIVKERKNKARDL